MFCRSLQAPRRGGGREERERERERGGGRGRGGREEWEGGALPKERRRKGRKGKRERVVGKGNKGEG